MSSITEQQNLYTEMAKSLQASSPTPEEANAKLEYITRAAQNRDINAIRVILENDGLNEAIGEFLIAVFAEEPEFDGLDALLIECSELWVSKYPNLADPFARTYADRVASGKSISPLLQQSRATLPSQAYTPPSVSVPLPIF